ncbi:glycosyltransferase [Moorena sp. SIO3A2]|uniref:glycosyltransferase n=1 Tax=Moorena sp. SIO3A2 TaxID=2607841 RepID=UPI0013B92497|nr:glycosyltransferase [Moorena sp. SIO3A2]NER88929.1 glycosyltransferase family 1 protein [Moorena sp. SIO3A2]
MHVFILTLGSRGDVQPYVALGKGLKAAGHTVTVCTSASFELFIREHGLTYGYMNDEMIKLINSDQGRDAMENTTNLWETIKLTRKLSKQVAPMQRMMLKDSWNSAQQANPDLIIFHPKTYGGPHFAEKLGIPVIMAVPLPMLVPTAEFPNMGFPKWPLGGWYNKLTYRFVNRLMEFSAGKPVKRWRADHDLPPQRGDFNILRTTTGEQIPVLYCYSKFVCDEATDWPESVMATGYWFLEEQDTWQPPAELQNFLDAGNPPVYVGFGSMAGRDPQRLTEIVIEGLQQANVRGIIATGWGGLAVADLPDSIFKIDSAPHDWLFPRMAAVVHHGGAGTTAAGLRAGRPTIICPFFGDQPFWGERVHALGVGSKPIPQKTLTAEKLATAIREVTTSQTIRQNAEALGKQIRDEDGIANAIAIIESRLG